MGFLWLGRLTPRLHFRVWPTGITGISVSKEGIYRLFSNLQVHKAVGPDEIPTRLLKELAEELTLIFILFSNAFIIELTLTVW